MLTLLFVAAVAASGAPADKLLPATEIGLPRYHESTMESDLKAPEFLFDRDHHLWILGKTALWQWRPDERKLSRMTLHQPKSDGSTLARLATDGINLFASSRSTVYQVIPGDGRVFRYPSASATGAPRFVGFGDDFWWLAGTRLFKLDRYGKTLASRGDASWVAKAGASAYFPETRNFYWTLGKKLVRAKLDGTAEPRAVFSAKQPLLDVQAAADHLIAHTAHTVLRLEPDGTVLQAIPVEGRRKLVRMHISEERHAYLFDDQLLEVYDLKTKSASRYALPLDDGESITRLALSGTYAAIAFGDIVRLFRLGPVD